MFIETKVICFMEAAKTLNFTRAAEKLFISQPALSKNIASLEEECGMKLFYRDIKKSKVTLTPAGAVFLCEFQKMEKILSGVVDKAKRAEAGEEGNLVIGLLFGQIINDITKKVLNYIDDEYPKIVVEKISGGFRDLRTWLEDGTADMVVTYEEEAKLVSGILFEEVEKVKVGLVVPIDNPLSKKRKIKIKDLEDQRLIFPDERETFILNDKLREQCMVEGFIPNGIVGQDLNHINMLIEMGKGISIAREDTMVTRSPNVKFFPLEELGEITLVAAWKKENLNPIITFYHRMYENIYQAIT